MLRACPIFRVTLLFTVLPICANALTNTASNLDVGTGESLTLNGVHFYTEEVNIHNGGVVYVKSHDGTGNTGQLVLVAPVISISAGSLIDGDSAGYPAAQGPGQGSGGTGDGNDGSGGGYGGMGGLLWMTLLHCSSRCGIEPNAKADTGAGFRLARTASPPEDKPADAESKHPSLETAVRAANAADVGRNP